MQPPPLFFFPILAFTFRASTPIHQGQTRSSGLIRWTDWSFGQRAKEPPCSRSHGVGVGPGVLIDNTQQPWAWGVTGKDGQSAEGAWVLVTAGYMVSAPCSCKRSQRNGTVSHSGLIWERGREWNWITWSSVQVAQEEKCGSWIRHTCL